MRLSIGSTDGVDETVEGCDADAVAGHGHVGTARPAVGPRLEAVDGGRVPRRVLRVVATSDDVDPAVNLSNTTTTRPPREMHTAFSARQFTDFNKRSNARSLGCLAVDEEKMKPAGNSPSSESEPTVAYSRTFGRSGRWSNLPPFRLRFWKLESLFKV